MKLNQIHMNFFNFSVIIITTVLMISFTSNVFAEVIQNGPITKVTILYNSTDGSFSAKATPQYGNILAATVTVNNSFTLTGWDEVTSEADLTFLKSGKTYSEQLQLSYKAMGYGEGYATKESILNTMKNIFYGNGGLLQVLETSKYALMWVEAHIAYMEALTILAKDNYYLQLRNLFAMMQGIVAGYNDNLKEGEDQLNLTWLFLLNFQAEIGDVVTAVAPAEVIETLRETSPQFFSDLHCSALIKKIPNDIFFSHVTWNSYNSMLRQYKTYRTGNGFVTMSSYPGLIHSIDDWYMTHNRLAVMETTNGVYNNSLFEDYLTPASVSEFLRVMIANFIANDSLSWVQTFSQENSGTYNNQWMILNMGNIKNINDPLPSGTFWVAEQLPGKEYPIGVTAADMTSHLNEKGYWASYNTPYFQNVYNISGYQEQVEKYGDFFSYTKYARPMIFARNHTDVVDLQSMKRLMRYNNFKYDPLSLIPNCTGAGTNNNNICNPPYSAMLTIASRGDLNPEGNASSYGPLYKYVGRRNHGATDAKIATYKGMINNKNTFTAHVICGPTSDEQPIFTWSNDIFNPMPPIFGLPTSYNFSFVAYTTNADNSNNNNNNNDEINERNKWIGIGIGIAAAVMVLAAIVIVLLRSRRNVKVYIEEEESSLVQ